MATADGIGYHLPYQQVFAWKIGSSYLLLWGKWSLKKTIFDQHSWLEWNNSSMFNFGRNYHLKYIYAQLLPP